MISFEMNIIETPKLPKKMSWIKKTVENNDNNRLILFLKYNRINIS